MTASCPQPWSVFEDGALVRSAASLPELAATIDGKSRAALLDRLLTVDPFVTSFDHPMTQLSNSARAVRDIASEPEFCLNDRQVALIVSTYEAGLLVGYDGLAYPASQISREGVAGSQLTDVSSLAWRHGHAVKKHWSNYERLISALFRDCL